MLEWSKEQRNPLVSLVLSYDQQPSERIAAWGLTTNNVISNHISCSPNHDNPIPYFFNLAQNFLQLRHCKYINPSAELIFFILDALLLSKLPDPKKIMPANIPLCNMGNSLVLPLWSPIQSVSAENHFFHATHSPSSSTHHCWQQFPIQCIQGFNHCMHTFFACVGLYSPICKR